MEQPVLSVKDILEIWSKKREELWKLALVQRDSVWDEYRIGKLLDSLLKNYPLGMLLLCKAESTAVLEPGENVRIATSAGQSWQLLDGQQRTLALATLFSSRVFSKARFYLHMSQNSPELEASGKDKRLQEYITWSTNTLQPRTSENWDRSCWLDLGKFGDFLMDNPEVEALFQSDFANVDDAAFNLQNAEDIRERLKRIDDQFGKYLNENEHVFKKRVRNLFQCWFDKRIPIHRVTLTSAQEILQVFTRLNQEGVRTTAADIFFAGVKTQWNDAEECLEKTSRYSNRVLSRLSALRLIARLACYDEQKLDIIPLDLKRLKGPDGKKIVGQMKNIVTQQEDRVNRMKILSDFLVNESKLGHVLRHVDDHLLDHAYCWAMNNSNLNNCDLMDVATYLFAGTAFRLYPVLRDAYSRLGFEQCYEKGRDGEQFPFIAILQKVKFQQSDLGYSWRIPLARTLDEQRGIVRDKPYLFLSLVQNLPFQFPDGKCIEWDHIYAQALARRMKWKGPTATEHSHYHRDYSYIWKVGNLCALSSTLNESLGDSRPEVKLQRFKEEDSLGKLWPADLFLSDDERKLLLEADDLLEDKKTVEAMACFRKYVENREDRIWQESVKRFPKIYNFQEILSGGIHTNNPSA
jgi:hypothetical protein